MSTALTRPPRSTVSLSLSPKRTDNDRLLVLTLAVILVQNDAPVELILALLYIVL